MQKYFFIKFKVNYPKNDYWEGSEENIKELHGQITINIESLEPRIDRKDDCWNQEQEVFVNYEISCIRVLSVGLFTVE